jgi:hypothetical protein
VIRRVTATVLLATLGFLAAGCGDDGPALPEIPAQLPDAAKDPAAVEELICKAGDAWIEADGTQRKIVEPPLKRLIGHYRDDSDETVKNLAIAADALLTARGATRDAAVSEFRKKC